MMWIFNKVIEFYLSLHRDYLLYADSLKLVYVTEKVVKQYTILGFVGALKSYIKM